jgi:hypothetical protein
LNGFLILCRLFQNGDPPWPDPKNRSEASTYLAQMIRPRSCLLLGRASKSMSKAEQGSSSWYWATPSPQFLWVDKQLANISEPKHDLTEVYNQIGVSYIFLTDPELRVANSSMQTSKV